ncbi:MAG TPA: cob(I)yrinic acid a,c-diamide adenosyltransferase [Actinomycetes bacterium]|nr:cob(I)yrinic acid a,c-diamide adenosyltransferase [Actinomycetes bacterium]
MVNLTRIYTRTGDTGTTALGDMSRVSKNDLRLVAYADVDEANAAIGVVSATPGPDAEMADLLTRIQNDLFDVGADLCTPVVEKPEHPPLRVEQGYVDQLEVACDYYNERLSPLRSFVLPGGTLMAAHLHVARTIVRRAERSTWAALSEHGETMNPLTATYLNRLSDLLFILSRVANTPDSGGDGDRLWNPGGER